MRIQVPYGRSFLTASLPDAVGVDVIEAPEIRGADEPLEVARSALDRLLGAADWSDFAGARSVAIAINDKTRPVPHHQLLPPLLDRLAALGIPDAAITFYVAVGTHPPMTPDEFPAILPNGILRRYRVVSHDSEDRRDLASLGERRPARRSGRTGRMRARISRSWWATSSRTSSSVFRAA